MMVFCSLWKLSAQTDGISYQAVIIGPSIHEIPGQDVAGDILARSEVPMRFTITDDSGVIDYQEVHLANTDAYGMVNLIIGHGTAQVGIYTEIVWDGEPKQLTVEVDLGDGFIDLGSQELMFTPHAYHRDILATGDLTVEGEVDLNGNLEVDGHTLLNNTLTVANGSATSLTGSLSVDGTTTLNDSLTVSNAAATELTGTLNVIGITNLNDNLTVSSESATELTGTLDVAGATQMDSTLTVNNLATIDDVSTQFITVQSDQPGHVAIFENLNGANGDGLLIKLGRTHGAWDGSAYLFAQNPVTTLLDAPTSTVRGWLDGGNFQAIDMIGLVPAEMIGEAMISITNELLEQMNNGLGLPIEFPALTIPRTNLFPRTTIFPGVGLGPLGSIPRITIPEITIPETNINPAFTILPRIPRIPLGNGFDFSIPNLSTTSVTNSLTEENEYVTFQDMDGRVTGSIRAQSVQNFRDNTILDNVYLLNVVSGFIGIDLLDGFTSGVVEISNLIDLHNHIGVEYSSGHGDYAEWLERVDSNEYLTAGDIVAVKGGKITRDLNGVEQIMVVSHKPIILGNAPEEGEEYLGNNVAFMGQVPVKVMGPVRSGDYIVANADIKGYGKAIHPKNMTSKDHTLAVGRSWEEKPIDGPKTVNTVVGVHNGDWAKIMMKLERKQRFYESKFDAIEARVNQLKKKTDNLSVLNEEK